MMKSNKTQKTHRKPPAVCVEKDRGSQLMLSCTSWILVIVHNELMIILSENDQF